MEVFSEKLSAAMLVDILVKKGLRDVVISPGSRNAPLTIAFVNNKQVTVRMIFDERSGGFIALGMAQQQRKPVAVLCTSGSAALNYAPAVAEAFYQKIPLLVLTADRPLEWIDQGDGQTIKQENIFANFIKKSFQLPGNGLENKDVLRYLERMCSEMYDTCTYPYGGPVHVNIPFGEPLYNTVNYNVSSVVSSTVAEERSIPKDVIKGLRKTFDGSAKTMVLCGMMHPSQPMEKQLQKMAELGVVILTETTSNVFGDEFISTIDAWLATIQNEELSEFTPNLLITLGGAIVSKKIKGFLRKYKPKAHWHVSISDYYLDTFQSLSLNIQVDPLVFLNQLLGEANGNSVLGSDFKNKAIAKKERYQAQHNLFLEKAPYSDLKVFESIFGFLPKKSQLQLGNSTPIRYAQLFNQPSDISQFCNRGTSGIDGCVSTALGAALVTGGWVTLVVGDVSFFYDANALWNRYLPANLRVIIINNDGGNIFRIIDGPSTTGLVEDYFEVNHGTSAKDLAKAYNVVYNSANNLDELRAVLQNFYNDEGVPGCRILEVFTPNTKNPLVLKDYFKFLKEYKPG